MSFIMVLLIYNWFISTTGSSDQSVIIFIINKKKKIKRLDTVKWCS